MSEVLTFDPATHTYYVGGRKVPGVTSILESQGLVTLGGTPEALAYARDRGLAIHVATELDDKGELVDSSVHPSLWPYIYAWRAFREEWSFSPIEIEKRVYHPTYRYAGTLDRTGTTPKVKTGRAILDIKSGVERDATGPQLAAYLHALSDKPAERKKYARLGVYLRDDCTYKVVSYDDPNDWYAFTAALTLHNWKETHA